MLAVLFICACLGYDSGSSASLGSPLFHLLSGGTMLGRLLYCHRSCDLGGEYPRPLNLRRLYRPVDLPDSQLWQLSRRGRLCGTADEFLPRHS